MNGTPSQSYLLQETHPYEGGPHIEATKSYYQHGSTTSLLNDTPQPDSAQRRKLKLTSRLTFILSLFSGLAALVLFIVLLLSCQTPSLSSIYMVRLGKTGSTNEARFGYFGVCTLTNGTTTCQAGISPKDASTVLHYTNPLEVQTQLQPLFTSRVLMSTIALVLSIISMAAFRLRPTSSLFSMATITFAWVAFLLTWTAASVVQQVVSTLVLVSPVMDGQETFSFRRGGTALALHWALASFITAFAVQVTTWVMIYAAVKGQQKGDLSKGTKVEGKKFSFWMKR